MRKNKMMRTAAVLGVATMLTASVLSGTFAKYTTTAEGTDSARVAKWGFEGTNTITLDNLFSDAYSTEGTTAKHGTTGNTVNSAEADKDIIAPGTAGSAQFGFTYDKANAPEVAYTFVVDTNGSSCDQTIQNNTNIQWKLDDGNWVTWNELISAIEALDGNQTDNKYAPNTLPSAFSKTGTDENANKNLHTVSWQWLFNDNDKGVTDSSLGNAAKLAEVTLKINITATQVD